MRGFETARRRKEGQDETGSEVVEIAHELGDVKGMQRSCTSRKPVAGIADPADQRDEKKTRHWSALM